jgi:Protein of unknown function (DUF732)
VLPRAVLPWQASLLVLHADPDMKTLIGAVAAVAAIALAPAAGADPATDAADRYYFSRLAAENIDPYDSTNQTGWRITDPALAIETGHWLCNRLGIDGTRDNKVVYELIDRSRVVPWGFVWSSADQTDEFIGAVKMQIAAVDAYCPQYFQH